MNLRTTVQKTPLQSFFESNGRVIQLGRRNTLVPEAAHDRSLYMIKKGSLVTTALAGDNEAYLSFVEPNEVIGVDGLFDDMPSKLTSVSYKPRSEVTLMAIGHSAVRKYGIAHPEIYAEISSQIHRQLTASSVRLLEMMHDPLDVRCFKALQQMSRLPESLTHPAGIQIKLTRIELSLILGCSRETAGRMIRVLADKGLIEVAGSQIVVFGDRNNAAR